MVNIIKKIVAPGHGKFVKPNPIYFAVHSTANPGATAANHVNYWSRHVSQGGGQDLAVHFVSDWKEAYQCVELDNVCWQVGNGNRTCIGLEICEATNEKDFLKGLAIAKEVILSVLKSKGWNVDDHVRSHKWFSENYGGSDHIDPIPYFTKFGWTWKKFIDYLKEDEVSASDIWNYKIKNPETGIEYTAADMLRYNNARIGTLAATDDASGRNKNVNMKDRLAYMAEKQEHMQTTLDEILTLLKDKK